MAENKGRGAGTARAVEASSDRTVIDPCGHRVLIKPDPVAERTKAGIFLPETTRDDERRATSTGVILAVGRQAWKAFADGEPWAKAGDRVLFSTYAGRDLQAELRLAVDPTADRLTIVNDEDILSVIR